MKCLMEIIYHNKPINTQANVRDGMWSLVVIGENLLDIIEGGANLQYRFVKFIIWK